MHKNELIVMRTIDTDVAIDGPFTRDVELEEKFIDTLIFCAIVGVLYCVDCWCCYLLFLGGSTE